MSYTIMSFCGGGIRGLASVTMLQQLSSQFPNLIKGTNMLAGTSTGAGIAAALANGVSPEVLIERFKIEEAAFFEFSGDQPTEPAYNVSTFATSMQKLYKTQTLNDLLPRNILMTAFNVGDTASNTGWSPMLFNNFPASTNGGTSVADAVVASGAMPGMFGSYQGCVDGAFVNHDPTLAAIALAVASGVALTDIVAICFGTGFMQNSLGSATATWGAEQWQNGDPQNPYNVPPLLIEGTPSPILNISLNGTSSTLMTQLCTMMLGPLYASLNPTLARFIPENDTSPADLDYLVSQAQAVDFSAAENLIQNHWNQSSSAAGR